MQNGSIGAILCVCNEQCSPYCFLCWVTSNLEIRVYRHKNNEGGVFTSLYKCSHLLHYENYQHIQSAIQREKQLKN